MQLSRLLITVGVAIWSLSLSAFGQVKSELMVYPPYLLNENKTLLYLQAVKLIVTNQATKDRTVINLDGEPTVTATMEGTNTTINVAYANGKSDTAAVENFVLNMKFGRRGGYWRLVDATMDGEISLAGVPIPKGDKPQKLISRMDLSAPTKMSFHCGIFGPLSVKILDLKSRPNATVSVELIDFQLQPDLKPDKAGEIKFGRSYDCVGFFSIGILSGWFVAIILLGLLSWGIKMLSNVHTMDRFDDPKGKTITVNATD